MPLRPKKHKTKKNVTLKKHHKREMQPFKGQFVGVSQWADPCLKALSEE